MQRSQCAGQPRDVFRSPRIENVEVTRCANGAVRCGRSPSDENEPHLALAEDSQQAREIRHAGLFASLPALRNSSVNSTSR